MLQLAVDYLMDIGLPVGNEHQAVVAYFPVDQAAQGLFGPDGFPHHIPVQLPFNYLDTDAPATPPRRTNPDEPSGCTGYRLVRTTGRLAGCCPGRTRSRPIPVWLSKLILS